MKFESPEEFRQELERKILEAAQDQDKVAEVLPEVAFDRALARYDFERWTLSYDQSPCH